MSDYTDRLAEAWGITPEDIDGLDPEGSYARAVAECKARREAMAQFITAHYEAVAARHGLTFEMKSVFDR